MDWRERVSINPQICHGKPCVKGSRVMVSVILDNLAEGESYESIMDGYRVTHEDIQGETRCPFSLGDYGRRTHRNSMELHPVGTRPGFRLR